MMPLLGVVERLVMLNLFQHLRADAETSLSADKVDSA